MMIQQQLFSLGQKVSTPNALAEVYAAGVDPHALLARHSAGDWGEIDPADRGLNEQALVSGARIFSVYKLSEALTVWVITEAADDNGHREATTMLLPSEY